MKRTNRFLSILLALCMLLSVCSATAFAAGPEDASGRRFPDPAALAQMTREERIEASVQALNRLDEGLHRIESAFVPGSSVEENLRNAADVFKKLVRFVENLETDGLILGHEMFNGTIDIQLPVGCYVYEFNLLDYLPDLPDSGLIKADSAPIVQAAASNEYPILTAQPYQYEISRSSVDGAARLVENVESDLPYKFTKNADNKTIDVEFMKHLHDYHVIIWDGHGGYSANHHSFIGIGETYGKKGWFGRITTDPDSISRHYDDLMDNSLIQLSGGHYGVTAKFFDKYYDAGSMNAPIIYLGCCHGADDNVLTDSLIRAGAETVLAYKNSVTASYDRKFCNRFFSVLTTKERATEDDFTKSAQTALDSAKDTCGSKDDSSADGWERFLRLIGKATTDTRAEIQLRGNADFRLVEPAAAGQISGRICKASDRSTPISDAVITISRNGYPLRSISCDAQGNYSSTLPAGEYCIKITAHGYLGFTAYATVTEHENTYLETFLMVEGTEGQQGSASGRINNAMTGAGLGGVSLKIRSGWNCTTGNVVSTASTDSGGGYSVQLPIGNYTMEASKDGYVTGIVNIIVQPGTTGAQDGTLTPAISDDAYRIVLTWGSNPGDLDSHLAGPRSGGGDFHVYYASRHAYDGNVELCNLDVDDRNGSGPETITLHPTTTGPYTYYVHHFSGSGSLITSGAQVKVFRGSTLLRTFNVPTDQTSALYWNVFSLVNGNLVVRNTLTSSPEAGYAANRAA